ncbi:alpha/beta-hydrolase [Auriscalpium vulgare]|uniref:Alpha/beta-hydrolase n=1 Tax=Auriscalpium vulgare TaxID=40419 RepID=A0ACB8RQ51_9AGAM|nr:alpha/beta-hydrolase [Auriscalpium vulgare]
MSSKSPAQGHADAYPLPYSEAQLSARPKGRSRLGWLAFTGISLLAVLFTVPFFLESQSALEPFYSHIVRPKGICTGVDGRELSSFSGYIGLKGDSDAEPKRSFFWFFEAENDSHNAPIILTIGGGPGTSGLLNPIFGQSHCILGENGTSPNPNRWTEKFNLLAVDHPVGTGFSYGTQVDNSRDAAFDVYDFLQKFYRLHPHLVKNQFVIAGGSYGGVYVPNIATVIHEQNIAIGQGRGQPGAVPINLESLMVSNPWSDPIARARWLLQYRCVEKKIYNETTCLDLYAKQPACLEAIEYAYGHSTRENRFKALIHCGQLETGDSHGTVIEDVRRKCANTSDIEACYPSFKWAGDYFGHPELKAALGVPDFLNYSAVSYGVGEKFATNGDHIYQHHRLYEPLVRDGIRLMHYVGAQDANCDWMGVFSFLKLLNTPFHEEFMSAPDVPWPAKENATVRVTGAGAGNFTFVLITEAGHLVTHDQPALVKSIVEHWVENKVFEVNEA